MSNPDWLRVRSEQLAAHLLLKGHPIVDVRAAFYFDRHAQQDLARFAAALQIVRAEKARVRARRISLAGGFTPEAPDGGAQ